MYTTNVEFCSAHFWGFKLDISKFVLSIFNDYFIYLFIYSFMYLFIYLFIYSIIYLSALPVYNTDTIQNNTLQYKQLNTDTIQIQQNTI